MKKRPYPDYSRPSAKPLRDYSRSSSGVSPAEKNRRIIGEGVKREGAELDEKWARQVRFLRPPEGRV